LNVDPAIAPSGAGIASGVDEFLDRFRFAKPFFANRVTDPTGGELDVPTIHDRQFHALVEYAEQAQRDRCGIGVVVWGEPGIGKSHLLARLCRWADQDQQACYVFLHNIQASPERLPRYVLKCVISRLASGRVAGLWGSKLYWLVTRMIKEALQRWPPRGALPTAIEARDAYLRLAEERIAANHNAGADSRRVYEVLFRLFLAAYDRRRLGGDERPAQLALRWLSGDELDAAEAADIGLGASPGSDDLDSLPDEQSIESVLVALAEHAAISGQTLMLCFDQVDNLTDDQIRALTQFLHPLIENTRNLLVITSGVQHKLFDFQQRQMILSAAWERIAQDELRLERISLEQARQLLELRLERFLEPFVTLPEVKRQLQDDGLFPLGRAWLAERFAGLMELRPRDVINWARDRWEHQRQDAAQLGGRAWLEQWSGGPAAGTSPEVAEIAGEELERRIDEKVAAKIQEQITRRKLEPEDLPPDSANLCGLVARLLQQALAGQPDGPEQRVVRRLSGSAGRPATYHLIVHRSDRSQAGPTIGLTFLATGSATSTTATLRRLVNDTSPPTCVLLVTDERRPLSLGERGREHLKTLQARGPERFCQVELKLSEYAELDALEAVIGDARSGDLEIDLPGGRAQPVGEEEVVHSHRRRSRYRQHRLLNFLLADSSAVPPAKPAESPEAPPAQENADDRSLREFIRAQLAFNMGMMTDELAERYLRDHPETLALDVCRRRISEVALRMHEAGELNATPNDDQLFLLLK
jgi:hypothetical protein